MSANSSRPIQLLRVRLEGLIQCCPVDQSNPIDCPLYALRNMPEADRRQWFYALSEDDLQYLADYHDLCSKFRLHTQKPVPGEKRDKRAEAES